MTQRSYSEDDLLPVSALADLMFCERRAALHHIEKIWEDNLFTAEGTILHERTDSEQNTEVRGDIRIAHGLRLRSLRLGLSGKADVVEFHRVPDGSSGVKLERVAGFWQPFPVEYKRGTLRHEEGYEVQLCAQALCLEEMLCSEVPTGALFYGKTARRLNVDFDEKLRQKTEIAAARLHELFSARQTPPASYENKCEKCSLISICLPKATSQRRNVRRYLAEALTKREEESQ
jgi:CRISPR-associated exonuclease Cas4